MSCKNNKLKIFIDWLHGADAYMYQNVVMVWVNLLGGGLEDNFATGFLSYMPTHVIGLPPAEPRLERNTSDYLYGNLVATNAETGHAAQLIIKMKEPAIELYLLNVKDDTIETVKMEPASCELSGMTLTIKTEGSDGLSYKIILSAKKALAIPHQVVA